MKKYDISSDETDTCYVKSISDYAILPNISSYFVDDVITVCKDDGATTPWMDGANAGYYVDFMDAIIARMRQVYNNNALTYKWFTVDVSEAWFTVLKDAVDTNKCSFLISTATVTPDRAKQVSYSCSFAAVKDAFLRGEKDPNLSLLDVTALNSKDVTICVQKDTTYYDQISERFQKAKVTVVGSQTDCYPLLQNREVHVALCDNFCLNSWLVEHRANCSSCRIYKYGDAGQFAPMFPSNSVSTLLPSLWLMATALVMTMFVVRNFRE
jgi:ABC-type amino acid transport substrate-binding protein